MYLVRGTDNTSVQDDQNYYDTKLQQLTISNGVTSLDIIGVQILCNIQPYPDYKCTAVIKSPVQTNGIFILVVGFKTGSEDMEVKYFNRVVFSPSINFDLGGVSFYQKDYYPAEGFKGYTYSSDAREAFFAVNGMDGSKIQPHGSDSIRSSIIARNNPQSPD